VTAKVLLRVLTLENHCSSPSATRFLSHLLRRVTPSAHPTLYSTSPSATSIFENTTLPALVRFDSLKVFYPVEDLGQYVCRCVLNYDRDEVDENNTVVIAFLADNDIVNLSFSMCGHE
jgi:hypothetical protein